MIKSSYYNFNASALFTYMELYTTIRHIGSNSLILIPGIQQLNFSKMHSSLFSDHV